MKRELGQAFLKLNGWKLVTGKPDLDKYVLIAAPHTTNWDFVYMIAMAWSMDLDLYWMGKHTLFDPPFGFILKAMGGVPVDRRKAGNMVESIVSRFASEERFVLVIPAEGTRKKGKRWKSGFYHIARGAKVPVVLGWLDYALKEGGLGEVIEPTGDIHADMDRIRAFYHGRKGKFHENFTEPYLKEEGDAVLAGP